MPIDDAGVDNAVTVQDEKVSVAGDEDAFVSRRKRKLLFIART